MTYVCVRVDDLRDVWLVTLCEDVGQAMGLAHWFHGVGSYAFAGRAARLECAHRQLRQALHVPGGGLGPLPWTGWPTTTGGGSMNVAALRESFERAVDADPELAHHFYQRLFAAAPRLRGHFPREMAGQERVLGEKLVEIMGHLEDPAYLQAHLAALGHRHATQYRVTPEMFDLVAEHLIGTLEGAVRGWGERAVELRQEWTAALQTVASLMLAGFPEESRAG